LVEVCLLMTEKRPCVGIDISASALTVAVTYELDRRGEVIPPYHIDFKGLWWQRLLELCTPRGIVVCEPTGWHYSAPVVKLLHDYGCEVYYADHYAASDVRRLVPKCGHKSDTHDARALCFLAHSIGGNVPISGVHRADPDRLALGLQLRTLVSAYDRATKDSTRAKNRLRQLAHAISPIFAESLDTYLELVKRGYAQPNAIRAVAQDIADGKLSLGRGRRNQTIVAFAQQIPPNIGEHPLASVMEFEVEALQSAASRAAFIQEQVKALITTPPLAALTELWLTVPSAGLLDIARVHAANYGQSDRLTFAQFRTNCASTPHTHKQSGDLEIVRATWKGYKPAKIALTLWTIRLLKGNNPIARKYRDAVNRQAVNSQGKSKALAIARSKLLEILHSMVRTGRPYYDKESRHE
jgi:hypothetical protein